MTFAQEFLRIVANVSGEAAVERMIRELGGTRVYVPVNAQAHHVICSVLPVAAVRQITKEFGCGWVALPLSFTSSIAVRRAAIRELNADGKSASTIARELGVSVRTVFRHRRAARDGDE
jgi:hypothetical protein